MQRLSNTHLRTLCKISTNCVFCVVVVFALIETSETQVRMPRQTWRRQFAIFSATEKIALTKLIEMFKQKGKHLVIVCIVEQYKYIK